MRMKSAKFALAVTALSCASITGCGLGGGDGTSNEDAIASYIEQNVGAPVPQSDDLDPYLVDIRQLPGWTDGTATLALFSDPASSPGMARVCAVLSDSKACEPPDEQTSRIFATVDGYDLYLFSGPDNVGFESDMAIRVQAAKWAVSAPEN